MLADEGTRGRVQLPRGLLQFGCYERLGAAALSLACPYPAITYLAGAARRSVVEGKRGWSALQSRCFLYAIELSRQALSSKIIA